MATREAELFKDKIEVTLDGRQIFYLFFGGAVIACMVFVLGVMVGRRVEARSNPPRAAAVVRDPLAALDALDHDERADLAFPAALRSGEDHPLGAVDEQAARGELKPAVATPSVPAARPAAPPSQMAGQPALEPEAVPAPPEAVEKPAKPEKAEKAEKPEKPAKPDLKAAGKFTLQLSSFQDKAEAEAFLGQMKQAGYAPFMVQAEVEGKGVWYRIRVGDFESFDEAVAAKAAFEGSQKIIAYVTRLK